MARPVFRLSPIRLLNLVIAEIEAPHAEETHFTRKRESARPLSVNSRTKPNARLDDISRSETTAGVVSPALLPYH